MLGLLMLEKLSSPSSSLHALQGDGYSCCPGSYHCLRTPWREMLTKDYSASLSRTRSVLGNLLLLWFVASWAVDRLDMDLCSLHSWLS